MINGLGEKLTVSQLPNDGTYPTNTTQYEKRNIATTLPKWHSDLCIQCGLCTIVCPHSTLRAKMLPGDWLKTFPTSFLSVLQRIRNLKNTNTAFSFFQKTVPDVHFVVLFAQLPIPKIEVKKL